MVKSKKGQMISVNDQLSKMLTFKENELFSLPDNWCWVSLSTLAHIISKGTTPTGGKQAYLDEGIDFLRVENINDDGTLSHEKIAYISQDMHLGFLKRSVLETDDILISIAGTLGKTGIVREIDLPMNTNQAIAFVRLHKEFISPKYIKYCIDNPIIQKKLLSQTKVTAIPNLTLEIISNCPIPLAPLSEQNRIVECLEKLFGKLDEAQQKIETVSGTNDNSKSVIGKIELMRNAILIHAFSGKLGTNDPRDESAVELLRRILESK